MPLSASAQAGEEGGSAVERSQPEATVDIKSDPTSTLAGEADRLSFWHDGALKIALFSSSGYDLEYSIKTEETKLRRRRIGIGVGVSVGILVVGIVVGAVVVSNSVCKGPGIC
jgi:hypothetical protein